MLVLNVGQPLGRRLGLRHTTRRTFLSRLTRSAKNFVGAELTAKEQRAEKLDKAFDAATANAPPIIKILSKVARPLAGRMMEGMMEGVERGREQLENVIEDGQRRIGRELRVRKLLGDGPILFETPHTTSQTIVNGKVGVLVEFRFVGANGRGGVARVTTGTNLKIEIDISGTKFEIGGGEKGGKGGFIDV